MWLSLAPLLLSAVASGTQTIYRPPPDYLLEMPRVTIVPEVPMLWPVSVGGSRSGRLEVGGGGQGDAWALRGSAELGGAPSSDTRTRGLYTFDAVEAPALGSQDHTLTLNRYEGERQVASQGGELTLRGGSVTTGGQRSLRGGVHAATVWSDRPRAERFGGTQYGHTAWFSADAATLEGDRRLNLAAAAREYSMRWRAPPSADHVLSVGLAGDLRTWAPAPEDAGTDRAELLVIALEGQEEAQAQKLRWMFGARAALRSDVSPAVPISPVIRLERRISDGKGAFALGAARVWDDTAIVPAVESQAWLALGGQLTERLALEGLARAYAREAPLSPPAELARLDEIRDAPTVEYQGGLLRAELRLNDLHGVFLKGVYTHRWVQGVGDEALLDPDAPWTPDLLEACRRDTVAASVWTSAKLPWGYLNIDARFELSSAIPAGEMAWWLEPSARAALQLRQVLRVREAHLFLDLEPSLARNAPEHLLFPVEVLILEPNAPTPDEAAPLRIEARVTVLPKGGRSKPRQRVGTLYAPQAKPL